MLYNIMDEVNEYIGELISYNRIYIYKYLNWKKIGCLYQVARPD